eukprot:scaffold2315_cov145-Isochrysis_galbana.AAC.12
MAAWIVARSSTRNASATRCERLTANLAPPPTPHAPSTNARSLTTPHTTTREHAGHTLRPLCTWSTEACSLATAMGDEALSTLCPVLSRAA